MVKIKVLLIEDDPMVREVNRQFIEKVDQFQVIGQASNGLDGVTQIRQHQPDLVFMDIFMPEQDGITSLRKIRELDLPVDVITVTAANDMDTVKQVLHLGVFDYIMKPFSFERVKGTLENYLHFKKTNANGTRANTRRIGSIIPLSRWAKTFGTDYLVTNRKKTFRKALIVQPLIRWCTFLQSVDGASAEDVASGVGIARVTARRYLDYLEKQEKNYDGCPLWWNWSSDKLLF
ncbi:response regulator [Lysinibacillus sp. MHQ-1]|nr:response regulator [Lysinibacillus sp. MHQ-1]